MTNCLMILIAIICLSTEGCIASSVCDRSVKMFNLNGDIYVLAKVRYEFPGKPKDCAELYHLGRHESGVYEVWPINRLFQNKSLEVYCDMETDGGGWTVIQRRGDFGNPKDYFYKDWKEYKIGFGDKTKEFWLGNDNIYALTNQKLYSARFDLRDMDKKTAFAQYQTFWIDDESHKYMLHISGYEGTAGDSLLGYHNNQKFSTKDKENDIQKDEHCAQLYKGAWWYSSCHASNLNGLNLKGNHKENFGAGINWKTWRGYTESLYSTEIKIRPKNFKLPIKK